MDILKKLKEKYAFAKAIFHSTKPRVANDDGSITVGKIVGLVVICFVIAYVLPSALQALGGMNTTGMSSGEIALIQAVGIIVVLVIFGAIAKEAE